MTPRTAALLSASLVLALGLPFQLRRYFAGAPGSVEAHAEPDLERTFEGTQLATTADVQALDQLWRSLEARHEQAAELGVAAFRRAFLEETIDFLRLDADQESRFAQAVDLALQDLREARGRMRELNASSPRNPEPGESTAARREAWSLWQREQESAADRIHATLLPTARHELFAEKRLHWLLRLDYGMRRDAESR